MRLSSRTQYAMQALAYMVRHYIAGDYVLVADIAAEETLSRKFLEHVMTDLRRAGIVESKQGRNGGFRLTAEPAAIGLGHALRAVEGRLTYLPPWVAKPGSGELADVLLRVRMAVREVLDNTTLEILARPASLETIRDLSQFT